MNILSSTLLFCLTIYGVYSSIRDDKSKWPSVGVSVLVRNKAHTLPYFLSCLWNLDYPKNRMYIWIYSDLNNDNSNDIIEEWIKKYASEYNNVYVTTNNTKDESRMKELSDWSLDHFRHVIQLREKALKFSRHMWADYLFMIDADVFLLEPSTLNILVKKNEAIVAPMLLSDGLYSNFWCGMTESYYYKRTDDYKPILERKNVGCFEVPMVHTAVLMSLRETMSDLLTYLPENIENYDGPEDDIIAFAINAKNHGIPLKICNDHKYGYVPVPADFTTDPEQMINIKLEALSHHTPIPLTEDLEKYITYPLPWKYGCDEIFMINLERRTERRKLMEMSFKEIGMDATLFNAIDGRKLDMNDLSEYSITLMPNYEDPYHKRPMKAGEVGCFLSHYLIWKKIVENNYAITLVLEDDIHFVPHFRYKFHQLMEEIKEVDWDLVYIGRKILQNDEEVYVTAHTTRPLYSYWTLGYLLSEAGARKLLAVEPLNKMLPVDEFLPIMFDQHPNSPKEVVDAYKSAISVLKNGLNACKSVLNIAENSWKKEIKNNLLDYLYDTIRTINIKAKEHRIIDIPDMMYLDTWKDHFPLRNLKAYSAAPLLVHPTHYTGQEGYISDTEDSKILQLDDIEYIEIRNEL